jgi:hypothetical protein
MTAVSTVTVECDHLGCEEAVEARDASRARREALRRGWRIAVKKGHTFHDFCPDHRENRSFLA